MGRITYLLGAALVLYEMMAGSASAVSAQVLNDCQLAVKRVRPSTIKLVVELTDKATGALQPRTGTGFIVTADGYVLASRHVVAPNPEHEPAPMIVGRVGSAEETNTVKLIVVNMAATHDVALLKITNSNRRWPAARTCRLKTGPGTAVCGLGYPLEEEFRSVPGEISSLSGFAGWWTTSAPSDEGESGSPITDRAGNVVAYRYGGDVRAQNLNVIIPISLASDLLAQAGTAVAPQCEGPSLPNVAPQRMAGFVSGREGAKYEILVAGHSDRWPVSPKGTFSFDVDAPFGGSLTLHLWRDGLDTGCRRLTVAPSVNVILSDTDCRPGRDLGSRR